jgi:thiamine biosynthesis protein ThiS
MEITLNGRKEALPAGAVSLPSLLARHALQGRPVLVEINGYALLATEQKEWLLAAGDVVEIIKIVAGG